MTITRASAEAVIVRRLGNWMTAAGLAVTTAGSNADLADPIAWAVTQAGGTVATAGAPVDADLATVSSDTKFLDLAEYRALQTVYQNYTDVDSKAGAVEAKQDQLRQGMEKALARKKSEIAATYGIGVIVSLGSVSVTNTAVW